MCTIVLVVHVKIKFDILNKCNLLRFKNIYLQQFMSKQRQYMSIFLRGDYANLFSLIKQVLSYRMHPYKYSMFDPRMHIKAF